jgi:hypothetical protein
VNAVRGNEQWASRSEGQREGAEETLDLTERARGEARPVIGATTRSGALFRFCSAGRRTTRC